MFSLSNPTDQPADILATFYYADGSGKYTLPVHLEAQASAMIDMAMLIAEHKPDSDGNVIPSNVQEGSAQFASAKGRNDTITLVIAGGIYNVVDATCGLSCINCCGDSNFGVSPNPIYCPIGGSMQCGVTTVDCQGYSVFPSSWSSSNTAVMTVNSSGVLTGVSVGSANITAIYSFAPVYTGQICGGQNCPTGSPQPSAPGDTTPRIDSISPAQGLKGATVTSVAISGQGFGTNPLVNTVQGITPSVQSASDTQITANFAISPTSPVTGNSNVTVTNQAANQVSNGVNFYIQVPGYLFSPSATQTSTPPLCIQENGAGYFLDVSYYVADANNSSRISQSGMAPGENLSDGTGWHDAFATPTTTRSDGSFDDTPRGTCYAPAPNPPTHFCGTGQPQSFRVTANNTVFSITTNTTSRTCTDGIKLVIQGNPSTQNKTYTFGNTQ
jgi:hypothetical protein